MALELDNRQRAMLQEMGVRVWLPGTAFALAPGAVADAPTVPAHAHARDAAQANARRVPPLGATGDASREATNASARGDARPVARPLSPPAIPRVPAPAALTASAAIAISANSVPEVAALDWAALRDAAAACKACGLCAGRKNTTLQPPLSAPGWQGQAHWMVVGDQPDEDEDTAGSAFADASGVLLTNMLKAIKLVRINSGGQANDAANRDAVPAQNAAYATNVVKCRAPHGAVPQATDLAQCAAYLQREIALVQPKMILAMGRFANQLLLSETPELVNLPLGKLRGTVYRYQSVPVVVTYHPKTLMRNSADKAKAWADLCLAADAVEAHTG